MANLDEQQLDRLLAGAAGATPFPPTPAMRGAVLGAIAERARPEWRAFTGVIPGASGVWRVAAASMALALVLALGGMIAHPGARTAVGEFLGFIEGQRVEVVPERSPIATSSPPPLSTFAVPVTLAEARAALGFAPGVPEGLGDPGGVYLVEWAEQPLLILHYPELDLWQTRGQGFFGKGVPSDAIAEPDVNGRAALWIASEGHETAFYDAEGNEVSGSRRTVDSHILAWNGEDGRYYRMETELSMEDAVAIANTLP